MGLSVVPNDQPGALRMTLQERRARIVTTSPVVLALWGKIERRYDSVIGQPRIVVQALHVGLGDSVKQAHAAPVLRCSTAIDGLSAAALAW